MIIQYKGPDKWMKFDGQAVFNDLVDAKGAVLSLTNMPIQRAWADKMQIVQLKREVAGTSRIEGADFTERELDEAMKESPEQLETRSQKQAAAMVRTYRWISKLPADAELNRQLILKIHQLVIEGADDDHCSPGVLRSKGENVTFGRPRHRGVDGGKKCIEAFDGFCRAIPRELAEYDFLLQALAVHYYFAAMHPFHDGNGRTARALETFMLQRTGLKDVLFIAMSNYYYEEKIAYLKTLAQVRAQDNDLTPFLVFGLKGIKLQCTRLLNEIKINVSKSLYRCVMYDLFKRLKTKHKRVIAERQLEILNLLLEKDHTLEELIVKTGNSYSGLKNPLQALIRDLNYLLGLESINAEKLEKGGYKLSIRLDWATEITETEFYRKIKEMPKSKTHKFL